MNNLDYIYGSLVLKGEEKPFEMHKQKKIKKKKSVTIDKNKGYPRANVDISWLSAASKKYNISSDIKDYIVKPVPALTSDIPNRNSQAFPLPVLVSFDLNSHRLRYKSFIGAPTHLEHKHDIPTNAKGVILDACILKVPKYGVSRVLVLSGWDRSKDKYLAENILKRKRNSFSMGAVCSAYTCSSCQGILGPGVESRTCTCPNSYKDLRSYGSVKNGILQYLMCRDPYFIELSSVDDPADVAAII